MDINANDLVNLIKDGLVAKNLYKNDVRGMISELAYNCDLMKAFRPLKQGLLDNTADLFDDDDDSNLSIAELREEILREVLAKRRTAAWQSWMKSSRNLDSLGWIRNEHTGLRVRLWDYIARVYHRMEVLDARLALSDSESISGMLVSIRAGTQLYNLQRSLVRAHAACQAWLGSGFVKRFFYTHFHLVWKLKSKKRRPLEAYL